MIIEQISDRKIRFYECLDEGSIELVIRLTPAGVKWLSEVLFNEVNNKKHIESFRRKKQAI